MKYIIYIFIILAILFSSNYTYVKFGLYSDDIKKCNAELIYKIDSAAYTNNILYLGESSNFTASDLYSSKESISELISGFDQNYRIASISKGAIHASTYDLLIKRLPENSSIKTVIVTMNLRSFGINWMQSDLETNLSRANILYSTYPVVIKKMLLSFKAYDNQEVFKRKLEIKYHYKHDKFILGSKKYESVYEWDKELYDKGVLDEHGVKNQEKTDIACHFIKNYAFTLNEDNPRVKDFDEISEYCKNNNIKLIFHLLPENLERATELCGSDLSDLMKQNVVFLKNRYSKDVVFIDNSSVLKDSCFIDRQWPTEHYIYKGRYEVAKLIHEQLKLIVR